MEPGNEASKMQSCGNRGLHTGNRLRKPGQESHEETEGQDTCTQGIMSQLLKPSTMRVRGVP